MRRRRNGAMGLEPAFFAVLLLGGITAGLSIAETTISRDMGYTLTVVGTLGGRESSGTDINKKGQVVGWSDTTGNSETHAFLYSDGTMADLTLGGSSSVASAINEKGQVIGSSFTTGNSEILSEIHLFLYSHGTMTDLTQLVYDLFLVDNFIGFLRETPPSPMEGGKIVNNQILGHCAVLSVIFETCILKIPNKPPNR